MAIQKSPHTQSQQDTNFAQTDLNPGELEQEVGTEIDADVYANREGAQTGAQRSAKHSPSAASPPDFEQQLAAYEGSLKSRVFDDPTKQGITNNPSSKEAEGQRKVVGARDDSQAGLNHSDKTPQY